MRDIKPIETVYKGYRFRSRLEARWAVFFDALGVDWTYEPQGFETSAGWYLPDFRLSCFDQFIVVGGQRERAPLYVEIKPKGSQGDARFCAFAAGLKAERPASGAATLAAGDPFDIFGPGLADADDNDVFHLTFGLFQAWNLRDACLAARSARFEFGETPR